MLSLPQHLHNKTPNNSRTNAPLTINTNIKATTHITQNCELDGNRRLGTLFGYDNSFLINKNTTI